MPLPSSPMRAARSPGFRVKERFSMRVVRSFRWVRVRFFTCSIRIILSRAAPDNSARADCADILCQNKAQKCGNTLCISNFCNAVMAQNGSKSPQTTLYGVAPMQKRSVPMTETDRHNERRRAWHSPSLFVSRPSVTKTPAHGDPWTKCVVSFQKFSLLAHFPTCLDLVKFSIAWSASLVNIRSFSRD